MHEDSRDTHVHRLSHRPFLRAAGLPSKTVTPYVDRAANGHSFYASLLNVPLWDPSGTTIQPAAPSRKETTG